MFEFKISLKNKVADAGKKKDSEKKKIGGARKEKIKYERPGNEKNYSLCIFL